MLTTLLFFSVSLSLLDWLVNPWTCSLLTDCNNCVPDVVAECPTGSPTCFAVSQGSVCFLIYIHYTADVNILLRTCCLLHQLHADDIQALYMYVHCSAFDAVHGVSRINWLMHSATYFMDGPLYPLSTDGLKSLTPKPIQNPVHLAWCTCKYTAGWCWPAPASWGLSSGGLLTHYIVGDLGVTVDQEFLVNCDMST